MQRHLSDFEIGDTLGVGTVGTIYRAKIRETGAEVALKILLPSVSDDPLIRARFRREMLILERISHPNIVKYFGGGRDAHQLFYAMEYVDSGSLKQVLQRSGPLAWREAASCVIQLCSALQHLHNHGIIHRDLKPGNLFFTKQGKLKLGDFGIARDTKAADLTADRLTVGTYAYMSPEQIRGDRDITGKTDLYALGCLTYEMLAGHPPYLGDNFAHLFQQHLQDEPPSIRQKVPACPAELDRLIRDLMAKDPELRPFNARTVQGRLLELLDDDGQDGKDGRDGKSEEAAADTSQDVAAASVDSAQRLLARRLNKLTIGPEERQVSWLSLAGLLLFILGVVWVAWQFSA